jgi:cell wall-associated NlpC family hydrolase
MHLRNANYAFARLAAGIFTSALVLATTSAVADETSSAQPGSSQAQLPLLSSSSVLSSFPSLSAAGQRAVLSIVQTGFKPGAAPVAGTDDSADASQAQASAAPGDDPDAPRPSFLAGVASKAGDVVVGALNLIGVRYRWGGNSPDSGLDCSGFVRYVFQDTLNFTLPRRAEEMSRVGEKVKFNDLKPGDLVFFNTVRRTISHVGIYIGHDKFVHSPSTGSSIRVDEMNDRYWETRFRGARRVPLFNADGTSVAGTDDGSGSDIAARLQNLQNAHVSY